MLAIPFTFLKAAFCSGHSTGRQKASFLYIFFLLVQFIDLHLMVKCSSIFSDLSYREGFGPPASLAFNFISLGNFG